MGKTVFILGAGASYQAGVPLMSNFLDEAQKILNSGNLTKEDEEAFDLVFKGISSLQSVHSKSKLDINNLESVFATFEMAKRLNKMPGFEIDEIPILIKSIRRLIVVTIERLLKIPFRDRRITPPKPYDKFAVLLKKLKTELQPKEDISILTFNYDIAADLMLHHLSYGPDYCLMNSTDFGGRDVVKLLKLHGSINWGVLKEFDRISPFYIEDFLKRNKFREAIIEMRIGSVLSEEERFEGEPVIIPPTWNKANFHNDLLGVWRESAKELEMADNLMVIGFSLPETDIFFRHLYALGTVGEVPFNRFWVFDPQENDGIVDKRYQALLGPGATSRYSYFDKTFEEAIDVIREEFFGAKKQQVKIFT